MPLIDRRTLLLRSAATAATLWLGGCDRLSASPRVEGLLAGAEAVNRWVQRHLMGSRLAREYAEGELSAHFKANGSIDPEDPEYRRLAAGGFAEWRLLVDGLVARPGGFSLTELRALPPRTQITRHDCVEGWSCIGKWTGVPLAVILGRVGLRPGARYVVFDCADTLEEDGGRYYESLDLVDAFHPQTILAYDMNDQPLTIPHGAPLRLRVERQLGYKMAKYLMRITVTPDLAAFGQGSGGYWEDRGYEWYAGI